MCGLWDNVDEFETMRNVLMQPIAPPSRRRGGIPAGLDAIIGRALARGPERRYQTAEEMADDLDELLIEMSTTAQAIPNLLHHLFGRDPNGARSEETVSATISATGTAGIELPMPTGVVAPGKRPLGPRVLFALAALAVLAAIASALLR